MYNVIFYNHTMSEIIKNLGFIIYLEFLKIR